MRWPGDSSVQTGLHDWPSIRVQKTGNIKARQSAFRRVAGVHLLRNDASDALPRTEEEDSAHARLPALIHNSEGMQRFSAPAEHRLGHQPMSRPGRFGRCGGSLSRRTENVVHLRGDRFGSAVDQCSQRHDRRWKDLIVRRSMRCASGTSSQLGRVRSIDDAERLSGT